MTDLSELAEEVAEHASSLGNALDLKGRDGKNLIERIRDGFTGWPSGGGFDAIRSGAAPRTHCFRHGVDMSDRLRCDCDDVTLVPGRSDPTGEAAIRADRAAMDLRSLERSVRAGRWHLHEAALLLGLTSSDLPQETLSQALSRSADRALRIGQAVEWLRSQRLLADAVLRQVARLVRKARDAFSAGLDIGARYSPRPANVIEQEQSPIKEEGCDSCARVSSPSGQGQWWNPVERTVKLSSGDRVNLCSWCRQTPVIGAKHSGEMPSKQDVEHYRDHGRARKRSA